MIGEETTRGFDFDALCAAIEGGDSDLLLSFYAEDSELRIVNAALPEGAAFELRGISQIERYLRAVCDQEMSCSVEGEVVLGEGRITFGQRCVYLEGTPISVRTTLEIGGEGKIVRQTDVARSARDRPVTMKGAKDKHEAASRVGHNRRNEKGRNRDDYPLE